MTVAGAFFVAGGVLEAALLLASIAFAWIWGTYRPGPWALIALLIVGAAAAATTVGLGRAMWRANVVSVPVIEAPPSLRPSLTEGRAVLALVLGITAIVLVWPFGIL